MQTGLRIMPLEAVLNYAFRSRLNKRCSNNNNNYNIDTKALIIQFLFKNILDLEVKRYNRVPTLQKNKE